MNPLPENDEELLVLRLSELALSLSLHEASTAANLRLRNFYIQVVSICCCILAFGTE